MHKKTLEEAGGFPYFVPISRSSDWYYFNSARSCLYHLLRSLKPRVVSIFQVCLFEFFIVLEIS